PTIGKVGAREVVERAVGEWAQAGAVDVDFKEVEPVLAVAAHREEDLPTIEMRLRLEDGPGGEVSEARQLAVGPGGDQGIEVAPRPYRAHGALGPVIGGASGVDVAVAPVIAALVDAGAAVGLLVEGRGGHEDDAGDVRRPWSVGRSLPRCGNCQGQQG